VTIGFGNRPSRAQTPTGRVSDTARAAFPPELWNRIEERLVFSPLTREDVTHIAALQLNDSARRLESERQITLVFEDNLIPFLIDEGGFDPTLGARPMRQTIQRLVEAAVAEAILSGRIGRGDTVYVSVDKGAVVVQ